MSPRHFRVGDWVHNIWSDHSVSLSSQYLGWGISLLNTTRKVLLLTVDKIEIMECIEYRLRLDT